MTRLKIIYCSLRFKVWACRFVYMNVLMTDYSNRFKTHVKSRYSVCRCYHYNTSKYETYVIV